MLGERWFGVGDQCCQPRADLLCSQRTPPSTGGLTACTDVKGELAVNMSRTIDLDVDIGADAVDYKYVSPCLSARTLIRSPNSAIANQESLSGLETEMRKLEGVVKEIVDELDYLKLREERFSLTNRVSRLPSVSLSPVLMISFAGDRVDERARTAIRMVHSRCSRRTRHLGDPSSPCLLQAQVPHRLVTYFHDSFSLRWSCRSFMSFVHVAGYNPYVLGYSPSRVKGKEPR